MNTAQDHSGWRIVPIPYQAPFTPVETNWPAMAGALGFLAGIALCFWRQQVTWLALSGGGFMLMLAGLIFKGRRKRRNWKMLEAKCLDREIRQVCSPHGHGGKTWAFRLLCEFELAGQTYRVTPDYWTTFSSETSVASFLDQAVSPKGCCRLYVNPANPLQAELVGHDLKDALLH